MYVADTGNKHSAGYRTGFIWQLRATYSRIEPSRPPLNLATMEMRPAGTQVYHWASESDSTSQ